MVTYTVLCDVINMILLNVWYIKNISDFIYMYQVPIKCGAVVTRSAVPQIPQIPTDMYSSPAGARYGVEIEIEHHFPISRNFALSEIRLSYGKLISDDHLLISRNACHFPRYRSRSNQFSVSDIRFLELRIYFSIFGFAIWYQKIISYIGNWFYHI